MGRLLRFRRIGYGGLMLLLVFALSSCATEQGGPTGEEAPAKPETREVTKTVTVAEAPEKEETTVPETTRATSSPPPAAAQAGSPEDVLALQYRLINAGDYEGAYALFDELSKKVATPEQFRTYFEANAPYSITDYSFLAADDWGDEAAVVVSLTATSGSGQESYEVTQPLVREGAAWRVMMRDEQVSSFTKATQGAAPETASSDPCASIPAGDYAVEECETGRSSLDGTSDRPLSFMNVFVSGADPGGGGGTGLSTRLARGLQEESGYDIVYVEVRFTHDFGGSGVGSEQDTEFGSEEAEEAYSDWKQKARSDQMEKYRRGETVERGCDPCPI